MEMLSSVPWWMFCAGGFSFLVVVAGMTAYTIFMNRMEAEAEKNEASGKGMAPVQHPEPLRSWVAAACACVDGGTSWTDEPPQKAQQFLASMWSARTADDVEARLRWIQSQEPSAWNLVGALRVAVAAHTAGLFEPARAWGWARAIAQGLQGRYPSFEAIGHDYLAARRAWKGFPADGSGDDAEQRGHVERFAALVRGGFRVDYRAPL